MENIASFLKTTISILITLAIISSGLFLWGRHSQLSNWRIARQRHRLGSFRSSNILHLTIRLSAAPRFLQLIGGTNRSKASAYTLRNLMPMVRMRQKEDLA